MAPNMQVPTFSALQGSAAHGELVRGFPCIGVTRGVTCQYHIEADCLEQASGLLEKNVDDQTVHDVRTIIDCLLCSGHQKNYHYKNVTEERWMNEFPDGFFSVRRNSAATGRSLIPSRSATPSSRAPSSLVTPTRAARPTPTSVASDTRLLRPPEQPARYHHLRSSSEPPPPTFTLAPVLPEIEEHAEDVVMADAGAEEGETVLRNINPAGADGHALEGTTPPVLAQPSDVFAPIAGRSSRRRTRSSQIAQSRSAEFHRGDAASWAPWTIRCKVREILVEPLPAHNQKGAIYVFQHKDHIHVKIGITERSSDKRHREIELEQGVELDEHNKFYISGIPNVKLRRLETLVHTDLAYWQCNLLKPTDRSYSTYREWFEIDFHLAQRTVQMWFDIMGSLGLEPGHELDSRLCAALQTSPALSSSICDGRTDVESWTRVNQDDESRLKMWSEILLSKRGRGLLKALRDAAVWAVCSLALFVLLASLQVSTDIILAVQAMIILFGATTIADSLR